MNSESKRRLKEFTFGYLGPKKFFNNYSFMYVTFTYREFVIRPLFRRISIPIENIEKLTSEEKLILSGSRWSPIDKWLKITHNYPRAPKDIYFTTTDFNVWLSAFERRGILTEDKLGLRSWENICLKRERSFNFPAAIFAYLAIMWALIDIIIENLRLERGITLIILELRNYFVIGLSISLICMFIYRRRIFLNRKR